MNINLKESELVRERKSKHLFLILSGVLLLVDIIQALLIGLLIHYAHNQHDTHFLPPRITQDFNLSNVGMSEGYLRDMSYFLVQLRFNLTPQSAANQFKALLGYVAPSLYGVIRAQLVKEMELIAQGHLSTVFYPTLVETDIQKTTAKVTGHMKRFVGSELMSEEKEVYLLRFSYEQGLLKITHLEQVNG